MNKHGKVAEKRGSSGKWALCQDPAADHGMAAHPRAACNVDTVRCGLSCPRESVPALHWALGERLGKRVRTKNNITLPEEEAEGMFWYLAIIDNYEVSFAPEGDFEGITHGDLAAALRAKAEVKFHRESHDYDVAEE